tara:strand:+ start:7226 stop:7576 length:351 start_codon:yes stop_codon:yes gene_type:complete
MDIKEITNEWAKVHLWVLKVAKGNDTLPRPINNRLRANDIAFGETLFLSENEILALPGMGRKSVDKVLAVEAKAGVPERETEDSPVFELKYPEHVLRLLSLEITSWAELYDFRGGV